MRSVDPEPKLVPVAEAPVAPAPAQRTYVDVPYSERAVLVLPVTTSVETVLFDDERGAVRRRVARKLTELGYDVIPIDEVERIEVAAVDGRLVVEGGAVCRVPLSPRDVHARYFSQLRAASVETFCFQGCKLEVVVRDPHDPDALPTYATDVEHGWKPGAWTDAAARLKRADSLVHGIPGQVISSPPPPIMFGAPDAIGPWADPPTREALSALESQTTACGHPDPNVALTWTVGLQVGTAGEVQRCEARTQHSRARSSEAQCICEAASTLRFPAGKPGRRVRVEGIDSGSHARTVVRSVQLETESWVTRLQESGATAKCEPELTRTDPLEVTAVLSLTPDGSVEQVELFGAIDDPSTMRWAACLVHEWSSLELPCAPPGIEQLQATVDFRGR